MIDLSLDRFDFGSCVEGFARGSHLRQHVWEEIVYRNIPQMTDDEMNFFWYIFRRDLWVCYFREINEVLNKAYGHADYLHALAVLHRGNRYKVVFNPPDLKESVTSLCYRFARDYRPLFLAKQPSRLQSFNAIVPDEWIEKIEKYDMPENRMVQQGKEDWWTDLSIYDDKTLL